MWVAGTCVGVCDRSLIHATSISKGDADSNRRISVSVCNLVGIKFNTAILIGAVCRRCSLKSATSTEMFSDFKRSIAGKWDGRYNDMHAMITEYERLTTMLSGCDAKVQKRGKKDSFTTVLFLKTAKYRTPSLSLYHWRVIFLQRRAPIIQHL